MSNGPFAMQFPSLSSMPVLDILRLIRTLNVGPITFFQLIERFGTAAAALDALPLLSVRGGRRNPLTPTPCEEAEKELAAVQRFGARFVRYGDAEYPLLLQAINDPPPLITIIGHSHLWQQKDAVAIVGARNASANGCQLAQRIAKDLGADGLLVVSGLARGIDAFVHKGALSAGTVGVIAGGIDTVYPPENEALFAHMREMGAIISEQPFGQVPFSSSFPARNRIIAGMALATLVVEAAPKSGSLITARLANEYGREVFAVPGSPLDPRAKGCNQLLKQGALMAENAYDVITGIAHIRNRRLEEQDAFKAYQPAVSGFAEDSEHFEARTTLHEKLGPNPVNIDELIVQTGFPAALVQIILLELELAGRLQRLSGNRVCLLMQSEAEQALNPI